MHGDPHMLKAIEALYQVFKRRVPKNLQSLLALPDGAAKLANELPRTFEPRETGGREKDLRDWESVGLCYLLAQRYVDGISIFCRLYDHMLDAQDVLGEWVHKGMPLVWLSDCYSGLGHVAHAKRYMMLTLCEDAVRDEGEVRTDAGVYFRLVWNGGLSDQSVKEYARRACEQALKDPEMMVYPEWTLQNLGQEWMTELPTLAERWNYAVNARYVGSLLNRPRDPSGQVFERLASYVLQSMPGCRVTRRRRSRSSEYDLVCSVDGIEADFRSELGRYFVCECKDLKVRANSTSMIKLSRMLDSTRSKFGILFSRKGISGQGKARDAEWEQLAAYHDRGIVIVVVDERDLRRVAEGENFILLLRSKYEQVRLDLLRGP